MLSDEIRTRRAGSEWWQCSASSDQGLSLWPGRDAGGEVQPQFLLDEAVSGGQLQSGPVVPILHLSATKEQIMPVRF
jgi:hypothetical protein